MPLVIPGINNTNASSSGSGNAESWLNKLAGKQLGDSNDETTFSKTELPKNHRVLQGESFGTADHQADRLNIYTNDKGIVENVKFG